MKHVVPYPVEPVYDAVGEGEGDDAAKDESERCVRAAPVEQGVDVGVAQDVETASHEVDIRPETVPTGIVVHLASSLTV